MKGPYGWGWPAAFNANTSDDVADAGGPAMAAARDRRAPADIDLRTTAAAGLMLQIAAKDLNSEANAFAALQAARAIASVQLPTGQVPSTARLAPKPAGHAEPPALVADRAPTCAALALMCAVIEANRDKPDARVTAAATRAATWLAKQPTAAGGWQSAYPPGGGFKARRVVRLDDAGYRDATYALILAANVLGRREYLLTAYRSVDQLIALRIRDEHSPGRGLWQSAATPGGDAVDDIAELPAGIDLLATRYAMETLLAAQVFAGRTSAADELHEAVLAIEALPKTDGRWERRYDLRPRKAAPPAPSDPQNDTSDAADPAKDDAAKEVAASDVMLEEDLARVLAAARQVDRPGAAAAEQFLAALPGKFNGTERMGLAVTGMAGSAFAASTTEIHHGSTNLPKPVEQAWAALAAKRFAEGTKTDGKSSR